LSALLVSAAPLSLVEVEIESPGADLLGITVTVARCPYFVVHTANALAHILYGLIQLLLGPRIVLPLVRP
jgi:hypothetical protein